jgi:hypothetical protein
MRESFVVNDFNIWQFLILLILTMLDFQKTFSFNIFMIIAYFIFDFKYFISKSALLVVSHRIFDFVYGWLWLIQLKFCMNSVQNLNSYISDLIPYTVFK